MKSSENDMDLDPIAVLQAVYAAYRQANQKDPLSYESFLANYQLDMETDIEIYFAVISKQSRKLFQKTLQKVLSKEKVNVPKIEIESVEDLYSLYVFLCIDPQDFWHLPIKSVQMLAENKSAITTWRESIREEMMKDGQK